MLDRHSHEGTLLALAVLALVFGSGITAQAQFRVAPINNIGETITCHVGGSSYELRTDQSLIASRAFMGKTSETQRIFNKVTAYTKLRSNIYTVPVLDKKVNVEICPGDVNYIAYNAEWLIDLYKETNSQWSLYAVIAHEIGHYVLSHDRTGVGSEPHLELEADEYAGETLAKMGASVEEAQAAYRSSVMSSLESHTHPPITQRLAAVKRGWNRVGTMNVTPEVELSQAYLQMNIDGEFNTISLLPSSSTSSSISASSSSSASSASSSSSSITDSTSGNKRRVTINGQRITKTFYLEYGKSAEVNLYGQNNKIYISSELRHRVRVNDRGQSNEILEQ